MITLNGDRRALLMAVRATDQKIIAIYARAAEKLARKAGAAKEGSLTERWAKDYEVSLRETIAGMREELLGAIRGGAQRAADLPAEATGKWLEQVRRRAGIDDSFRSALSKAPTEALRAMLNGRMYSDGKTLSSRIWDTAGRLQGGIEDVVAQGIAQGRSAFEMARDLEAYVNPNAAEPFGWNKLYPSIPFPLLVEYNAQRLARTSVSHAWWGAAKQAAGLNPLCQGMQWLLSSSHLARQVMPYGPDICDSYAGHDEGLGIGVYPIDKLPIPHPQCLCTQAQVVPEMGAAVDRINQWLSGGSDPQLERGFAKWREDNGVDNGRESGTIKMPDTMVPRSLGARATNADILGPEGDRYYHYAEGTRIQNQEVFAGYQTSTPLRDEVAEGLAETFGGLLEKWQHVKGDGVIDDDGENVRAEIHWFQEESVGQVKHMIKRWLE